MPENENFGTCSLQFSQLAFVSWPNVKDARIDVMMKVENVSGYQR